MDGLKQVLIGHVFGFEPEGCRVDVTTLFDNFEVRALISFVDPFDGEYKQLQVSHWLDYGEENLVSYLAENFRTHWFQVIENHFAESGLTKAEFITKHYPNVVVRELDGLLVVTNGHTQQTFSIQDPIAVIVSKLNSKGFRDVYFDHTNLDVRTNLDGTFDDSHPLWVRNIVITGTWHSEPLSTQKGIDLLKNWLTETQLESFNADQTIPCTGCVTGAKYLITRKSQINIKVLTGKHAGRTFCIVPTETVTIEDQMLAQKLIIENDENLLLSKGVLW